MSQMCSWNSAVPGSYTNSAVVVAMLIPPRGHTTFATGGLGHAGGLRRPFSTGAPPVWPGWPPPPGACATRRRWRREPATDGGGGGCHHRRGRLLERQAAGAFDNDQAVVVDDR